MGKMSMHGNEFWNITTIKIMNLENCYIISKSDKYKHLKLGNI
jgi:hypothetical protein